MDVPETSFLFTLPGEDFSTHCCKCASLQIVYPGRGLSTKNLFFPNFPAGGGQSGPAHVVHAHIAGSDGQKPRPIRVRGRPA